MICPQEGTIKNTILYFQNTKIIIGISLIDLNGAENFYLHLFDLESCSSVKILYSSPATTVNKVTQIPTPMIPKQNAYYLVSLILEENGNGITRNLYFYVYI